MVKRYDRAMLEPKTAIGEDGFLRARAIVTRTGIFQYLDGGGQTINELRHPDDVLHVDSLASMRMLPLCNGHPTEMFVTPENAKRLTVGFTGENVENDGENVFSNVVITDQQAIEEVLQNGKNQLSLGYKTDLINETGEWDGVPYTARQTNIRYNHLALVDKARAGDIAQIKLDSSDAIEITPQEGSVGTVPKKKIRIDNMEYEVDQPVLDSHEEMEKSLRNLEEEKKRVDDEIASLRQKLSQVEGERDSYKDQASNLGSTKMDMAERVKQQAQERVKLMRQAERLVDAEQADKFDSMNDLEIMSAAISKNSKNVKLDGQSEAYIKARFDVLYEMCGASVNTSGVVYDTKVKVDGDQKIDLAASRQLGNDKIQNSWKEGSK